MELPSCGIGAAVGAGEHAAHEDARARQAVAGQMAAEAAIGPRELRRQRPASCFNVWKITPCLGSCDAISMHRRAGDVADDDAIVEVERARVLRTREGMLNAGLRKQQDLRFDRHVESVEHRAQESLRALERQLRPAVVDVALQRRSRRRSPRRRDSRSPGADRACPGIRTLIGERPTATRARRPAAARVPARRVAYTTLFGS